MTTFLFERSIRRPALRVVGSGNSLLRGVAVAEKTRIAGPTRSQSNRASGFRFGPRTGFWAVAFSIAVLTAFSTAPSPLYGIYARQDHLSSITITAVYAVFAAGVVVSLLLVGHISDWYGRRPVLLPALITAFLAALVFIDSTSLPALFLARVLTGVALGAAIATGTAYLTDLDSGSSTGPTRRSQIVGTVANVGGLATGPLLAGVLARYI